MQSFPCWLWPWKGRHFVFNFAILSFNNSICNEKLNHVFNHFKYAAKANLAFGFVLKNIEDGLCRYFYAHENNIVMERSKFVRNPSYIVNLNEKLQKMNNIDNRTRKRPKTELRLYQLKNVTVFLPLLKKNPWVVKILCYLNLIWETTMQTALLSKKLRDNPKLTTSVCFVLLLYTCMARICWERSIRNFSLFSLWMPRWTSLKIPSCPHEGHSDRLVAAQYLSTWNWLRWLRTHCGTCSSK